MRARIRDYLIEAKKNRETPVIITRESSVVYNKIKDENDITIMPFQLPIVLSQIIEQSSKHKQCFVFDNLTDLILSVGFQAAYNFTEDALTRLSGEGFSALFLLNPDSHDIQEVQRIRNLFTNQLMFDNQIRAVKLG